jgi:hypothetical protein
LTSIHLDLDGAWGAAAIAFPTLDFRQWGPKLRYAAGRGIIDAFDRALPSDLPPFILLGSGDFHHLAALWLRRAITGPQAPNNLTLISFDNHPDWDIRPPKWGCGGWINRALEFPAVEQVHVWGCGNFELQLPARFWANRLALRSKRLIVHPWSERQPQSVCRLFPCMNRDTWRPQFEKLANQLAGKQVYVTIDLDCLRNVEARTNWENGLFTAPDIAWALRLLRQSANVIAGDFCGAFSAPEYSRPFQRFIGWWDHPKLPARSLEESLRANLESLKVIWPALAQE